MKEEPKEGLQVSDNLNALMLKTYGLGNLFKGYLEAVDSEMKSIYTEYFNRKIDEAKDEKHKKYLRKQLKYQLNKVVKGNSEFITTMDKILKPYTDASEESNEAIQSFMDYAESFIDAMVTVEDNVVRIREFRINQDDSIPDSPSGQAQPD